jgi:hypothetical protein
MDPAVAWKELTDALAAGNHAAAKERAEALISWVGMGGFNPINCTHGGASALLSLLVERIEVCEFCGGTKTPVCLRHQ